MFNLSSQDIAALDALIEGAGSVCLTAHTRPDGDAVGSTFALLGYLLARRGRREVSVLLSDRWPDSIAFAVPPEGASRTVIYTEDPVEVERRLSCADLVICLDFNTLSRVSDMQDVLSACKAPKVLIDHHPFPERESFELIFSETRVSSASELLLHVLKAMPDIDGDLGRLPASALFDLMTGITTDTNNFANSVFPSTLEACSDLIAAGVDRDAILDSLFKQSSEARVRAYGRLLADHMLILPQGAALIVLDKRMSAEMGLVRGDTEGLVNIPLEIASVRMSIFVHEEQDEYRVSVRSKRGVLANAFAAKYFAGGGHDMAAGGRIPKDVVPQDRGSIQKYVSKCVREYFG